MIRWGMAGTGMISRQIAEDFRHVEGASVVAVSSRSAKNAQVFCGEFGIANAHDDYTAMLDSPIDAVYIGTPHVTHYPMAREALLRGRHVLCEKPLGLDAHQVRQLADIARASGAFFMEAMWMKFNPLIAALREIIDAGEIGHVRAVRASFGAPFPQDDSSRWKPGGSALLDQGIYPVTLAHMLLGVPESVHARGIRRGDGVDLSEHFTLEYPGGQFAHGASSMVEFLDTSASVSGDRGWIAIDPGFWFASQLTVHNYGATGPISRSVQVEREGYGYVPMLRAVTNAIAEGRTEHSLHTLEETGMVYDTMDLIRRQLSTEHETASRYPTRT